MSDLSEDAAMQTEEALDEKHANPMWMSFQEGLRKQWSVLYSTTFQQYFNAYARKRGLSGLEITFSPARPRRRAPARR